LLSHFFRNIDLIGQYANTHSKLNDLTCEYLESLKYYAFLKINEQRQSIYEKKKVYLFYKKNWQFFSDVKLSFKQKLKTGHYLLPAIIGFYFYTFFVFLTNSKSKLFNLTK
jgi:hypothetical protein